MRALEKSGSLQLWAVVNCAALLVSTSWLGWLQTLWPSQMETSCSSMKVMGKMQWQTEEMVRRQLEVRRTLFCSIWAQIYAKDPHWEYCYSIAGRWILPDPWSSAKLCCLCSAREAGGLHKLFSQLKVALWRNHLFERHELKSIIRIINITSACADTRLPMAGNCLII